MFRSYDNGLKISSDALVDLQTHTILSDGKWTPQALLDHFVSEGFATAAITDHDRVDTQANLHQMARLRNFPLLVATEMTTTWRDHLVDILCFGFETDIAPLQALCDALQQAQSDNSRQIYQYLVDNDYIAEFNVAERSALIEATPSMQTPLLIDLYLKHNPDRQGDFGPLRQAGYKLCTNPTADVVAAVHAGGGVALIAHPGRTDGFATFDADLLDAFRVDIPIDGLEVHYPHHTLEQVALYTTYAKTHDWLVSAGSDSHAPDKAPLPYRAEQCAALLERLGFVVRK